MPTDKQIRRMSNRNPGLIDRLRGKRSIPKDQPYSEYLKKHPDKIIVVDKNRKAFSVNRTEKNLAD